MATVGALLDAHRAAGRPVTVPGADTVVWEQGDADAPAVLCLHGVPVSAYLYRRVLPELADRGLRGISFDLPGLGLAARPAGLDVTWTGLARWATGLVDALGLDDLHLVVHDVGGPIGMLLAGMLGERCRSLTVLNTIADPATHRQPPVMRPFAVPVVGDLYLRASVDPVFLALMRWQGMSTAVPSAELLVHRRLLLRDDGGRTFLRMMRSFELTEDCAARMRDGARSVQHRQVVWSTGDPALKLRTYGERAREVVQVAEVHTVPGKHFLQEDSAAPIAEHVARLVAEAERAPA